MLEVWQTHYGYTDRQAAERLGLELKEYRRQKATRPSRQTSLLLAIFTVRPDIRAELAAAAAGGPHHQGGIGGEIDRNRRISSPVPIVPSQ